MDDVDAVQAQIARNMLSTGDWTTARLDGVAYLEKAPLVYWIIALSYKIFGATDWAARVPIALSCVGLALLTTAIGHLGLWPQSRTLCGFGDRHLHWPVSLHAHFDSRRDAHARHRAGHVGIPARDR